MLREPAHPYTRALLAAIPSGASKGHRLSADERVPLPPRPMAGQEVLTAGGLRREFRDGHRVTRAVDHVSFTVAAGETLGIVGESGSGKTTVARILLGLVEPDAGEVRLAGEPWSGVPERRRRARRPDIALIAQDPLSSFDPRYDVERVVGEGLRVAGQGRAARRERVHEVLELVGLGPEYAQRHPRTLSGGQRQRVSIARAIATRPRIVVADEPVSALDVSVQAQILDLLADLQAELGTAFVVISHDLGVVHHVADRVLVMTAGRVVESGETSAVFHHPQHLYTRTLLAALPELERPGVRNPGLVPRPVDRTCHLGRRPVDSRPVREAQVGPDGAVVRWVELDGPGPARVYLHGLGAAAAPYFARAAAHSSLERRRSLLVDLLGFGLSDRPTHHGYSLDEHAATAAAVLDEAGVTGADVVGHSMGGSVAIVLAAARPDLVRSLVVVEPNLDPAEPEPGSLSSRGIAAWSEADFVATGFDRLLGAVGGTYRATMRLADPTALHRSAVGLVRGTTPTMREQLVALPIRRTLIEGALSEPDPGRAELAAAGVRCVVVPGAGHNVMLDAPDAFAAVLREAIG